MATINYGPWPQTGTVQANLGNSHPASGLIPDQGDGELDPPAPVLLLKWKGMCKLCPAILSERTCPRSCNKLAI